MSGRGEPHPPRSRAAFSTSGETSDSEVDSTASGTVISAEVHTHPSVGPRSSVVEPDQQEGSEYSESGVSEVARQLSDLQVTGEHANPDGISVAPEPSRTPAAPPNRPPKPLPVPVPFIRGVPNVTPAMSQRLKELEAELAAEKAKMNHRNISVPTFEEPTATTSAELWLSNVERLQKAIGAKDDAMLNAALCALKGKAGTWRENMELDKDCQEVKDFKVFKKAFLVRFGKDRSASDLLALLQNVSQKSGEGVRDFSDRLGVGLKTLANALVNEVPDDEADVDDDGQNVADQLRDRVNDARREGFLLAFRELQSLYFCSGLTTDLRKLIEPKFGEFKNYNEMVEKACEFERAFKSVNPVPMAGVQSSDAFASFTNELKSLNTMLRSTQSGQKPRGGQQQQQQQQQQNSGQKAPDPVARARLNARVQKAKEFRWCSKCKQWGRHVANECRARKTEIAALTPMDPTAPPPDGTPLADWYWDKQPLPTSGN